MEKLTDKIMYQSPNDKLIIKYMCRQTVICQHTVSIDGGKTYTLMYGMEIAKLFTNNGDIDNLPEHFREYIGKRGPEILR